MRVRLGDLRKVLAEATGSIRLSVDDVIQRFPDAYKYLLNGEMQDFRGHDIKTRKQLERHLDDEEAFFYEDMNNVLHYDSPYEREVWDPAQKMFVFA